jgi:hypothetical protein
MQYTDDRCHMRVEIREKDYRIPEDELGRMQGFLGQLGDQVQDFPSSDLCLHVTHHPRSGDFHVEAKLKVPGKTLFSGDWDPYLDCAFQRCVRKLAHAVDTYRQAPNRAAEGQTRRREALNGNIVAPENAAEGPLGKQVEAGDYRGFRTALSGYEEWLRNRVGRWIQRFPEAQARLQRGELLIGDLLEEVYLNAFERFGQKPRDVALHEWLDRLIDPSLKMLMQHPDEERENVSLARTMRETPL